MTVSRSNSSIKKEARDVLSKLYKMYYEETGQYLSPDDFFPVDLNRIISSVIYWDFESVSDVGYDSNGQKLRGHCNYDEKLIRVAFGDMRPGEKIFTAAHEIGHAVLHEHAHRTSPVSSRKKPIRRVARLTTSSQERKTEREADIFATELLMPEKAVRNHFLRVFGRKSIWVGSMQARHIITKCLQKSPAMSKIPENAKSLSPFFAGYSESRSNPSMREFFGVSKTAMSTRLLELDLVY